MTATSGPKLGIKKIGNTAVKLPKAKKLPGAMDKPSVFYKTEAQIKKQSLQKLRDLIEHSKAKQSEKGKEANMSDEKKYSAEEAAKAVLAKAHEMLLAKAHEDRDKMSGKSGMVRIDTAANQNQKGVGQHGHHGSSGGTSEAGAYHRDSLHTKPGTTQHTKNTSAAKELHQGTLKDLKAMPKPSIPGDAPGKSLAKDESAPSSGKGLHKLSKFVGKMEGKRGTPLDKSAEKGVHPSTIKNGGNSDAGEAVQIAHGNKSISDSTKAGLVNGAKADHREKLTELKAMPKPNLTKGEDPLANEIPVNRMKRAADYKSRGDHQNNKIAREGAIESHKEKLSDIKAQPKPSLTKGDSASDGWKTHGMGIKKQHGGHTLEIHDSQNGAGYKVQHTNPKGEMTTHSGHKDISAAKSFAHGLVGVQDGR